MTTTPNLGLTLLESSDLTLREKLNTMMDDIDTNALPVAHASTNAHFKLWQSGTSYSLKDIVRTTAIPLWGVWRCTTAGTSGTVEPTGSIEGTTFTDGTVVWKLSAVGADAIRIHNDLQGRGAADTHPTSAITGLDVALANTIGKDDYTESGIITYPTVTDNGNGTITFAGGVFNFYADGEAALPLASYTGVAQTVTPVNNSTNYICARLTGTTPNIVMEYYLANKVDITYQDIIPVLSIFRQGNFISKLPWNDTAKGTASKELKRLTDTDRFSRESGLGISEVTGRLIQIGLGVVWFALTPISLAELLSSTAPTWQFYHSSSNWVYTAVTQYNNTQYDNGTALATLDAGKYNVNWIYRDIGTDQIYLVLGSAEYTKAQAESSIPPNVLPSLISSQALLIGRIIVLNGATTAYKVQSAFDIAFPNGGVDTANDITITDAGSYFAGTNVEDALQEVGADKHTHANKTELDKIGEDTNGNLTYDNKTIVGGASTWAINTPYVLYQLVTYDNKLYKCTTAHTSGTTFTLSDWQELTIGYIGNWQPTRYYSQYEITINGNSIIRCMIAHTSGTSYDITESAYWNVIASRGAIVALWQPNTSYSKDEAVIYNDVIYLANSTHISGSTFVGDMVIGSEKWRTINTSTTVGDWKQVTETNIAAGTLVNITVNNTLTFISPPVEVLKYIAGAQGQVVTEFTFVAGDGASFTVDGVSGETSPYVTFDGTAHLNNIYNYQMVLNSAWTGTGQCSIDSNIDDTIFKRVEVGVEI